MDAEIRTLERLALAGDTDARSRWFEAARRAKIEPDVLRLERRAYDHATLAMANLENWQAGRPWASFGREVVRATVSFTEDHCLETLARCVRRALRGSLLVWDVAGVAAIAQAVPGVVVAAARHDDAVVVAIRATDLGPLLPFSVRVDTVIPLLRTTVATPRDVFGMDLLYGPREGPEPLFADPATAILDWARKVTSNHVNDGRQPFASASLTVASRWASLWGAP